MAPPNLQLSHADHLPQPRPLALRVLAHDLELAANVGALFRLADALGVAHLHLSGRTPVPPDPKIRRASRSAERFVSFSQDADPLATVAALRAAGWRVVSLELTSASVDVRALPVAPDDRVCLVLGAEAAGVSQALLDASDATVHLPMRGRNSSMNVASACAIALFEIGGRLAGGGA